MSTYCVLKGCFIQDVESLLQGIFWHLLGSFLLGLGVWLAALGFRSRNNVLLLPALLLKTHRLLRQNRLSSEITHWRCWGWSCRWCLAVIQQELRQISGRNYLTFTIIKISSSLLVGLFNFNWSIPRSTVCRGAGWVISKAFCSQSSEFWSMPVSSYS